jgi:pimeloyl-ACP methyl ester carboxylesterase
MSSFRTVHGRKEGAILENFHLEMVRTSRGNVETAAWGKGPFVLLLHGAMGGYDQGVLLARTVCHPRFHFLSISRPGYLGTHLSLGRTAPEQADLCAEVLKVKGIEQTAVIAISGGGPIALQFALRHPERCRAMVMISACSHRLDVPLPLQWYVMKVTAHIPGVAAALRRKIERDPENTAKRSIRDEGVRLRTVRDPETGPLFLALRTSVLDRLTERMPGTENDIRQTRTEMSWPLESIAAPTLVVHGTADSVVPFAQAQSLTRRLQNAELLAIEGGEHVSIFTHRQQVQSRIGQFLDLIAD